MAVACAVVGGVDRQVEPSRLRSHFGYLLATVLGLHVAGLLWMSTIPPAVDRPASASAPRVVHLRMRAEDARRPHAMTVSRWTGSTAPAPGIGQGGGAPVGASDAAGAARFGLDALSRVDSPPLADDAALLADLQAQSLPPDDDVASEYYPRSALSEGPQSQAAVLLEFPPQSRDEARYVAVLSLFIDETGLVRRVRVDDADMPEAFKEAAKRSFLQARFRPGQIEGNAVKSVVRVEVVFDSTPLDEPTRHHP